MQKVIDKRGLPRFCQIGTTGSSISSGLYVSVGASGRCNHACGFAAASSVLAINADPGAEIFEHADVGIVGDWADVVAELADRLPARAADVFAAP